MHRESMVVFIGYSIVISSKYDISILTRGNDGGWSTWKSRIGCLIQVSICLQRSLKYEGCMEE